MVDPQVSRSLTEAIPGVLASLGAWGVVSMHWLPDQDDEPVIWLTTRTERERGALESTAWLTGQIAMLLTRASVPWETLKRLRVMVDSEEGHRQLLDGAL